MQISFSIFLILYAYSENTPEVFDQSKRIRQKVLTYEENAPKDFKHTQGLRQF